MNDADQAAIRVEHRGGVAILTLNAPERHNALTVPMAAAITEAVRDANDDDSVGALIVQGEGGTFCSGAHRDVLRGAAADPTNEHAYREIGAIYDSFVAVGQAHVPTIAAVTGAAVGAGLNLLLATDLRIVAHDARLISGFAQLGIHPGGGHFHLLERTSTREIAAGMALFGIELSGGEAHSRGLAWESVEPSDVADRAFSYAEPLARDPELSRQLVAAFRAETGRPGATWAQALAIERGAQMWSLARSDLSSPVARRGD